MKIYACKYIDKILDAVFQNHQKLSSLDGSMLEDLFSTSNQKGYWNAGDYRVGCFNATSARMRR